MNTFTQTSPHTKEKGCQEEEKPNYVTSYKINTSDDFLVSAQNLTSLSPKAP